MATPKRAMDGKAGHFSPADEYTYRPVTNRLTDCSFEQQASGFSYLYIFHFATVLESVA